MASFAGHIWAVKQGRAGGHRLWRPKKEPSKRGMFSGAIFGKWGFQGQKGKGHPFPGPFKGPTQKTWAFCAKKETRWGSKMVPPNYYPFQIGG